MISALLRKLSGNSSSSMATAALSPLRRKVSPDIVIASISSRSVSSSNASVDTSNAPFPWRHDSMLPERVSCMFVLLCYSLHMYIHIRYHIETHISYHTLRTCVSNQHRYWNIMITWEHIIPLLEIRQFFVN